MRRRVSVLATILFTSFVNISYAQEPPDRSGSARAAMEALRPMAGEWLADVYMWRDGAWSAPEKERVTFNFILNDLALRKLIPERTPTGVRMETTIQYDQYRDLYRLAAMDDGWGNMDIYEGAMDEPGKIVFTNLRPETFAVGSGGEEYAFQLTLSIEDENAHTLFVEISTNKGETWLPFQRIERKRLQ
ncbi:MAG: DUF1579 family protein [Pseudomonadota bacterium]